MEPLWSPVVATSGNRSQMGHARNCGIKPKTLAGTRRPGLDRTTLTGERLARQAEPGGHSGQGCEGKEVPANLLVCLGQRCGFASDLWLAHAWRMMRS